MEISNCSYCGSGLEVISNCFICDKPYQLQCAQCAQSVENLAHTECKITNSE